MNDIEKELISLPNLTLLYAKRNIHKLKILHYDSLLNKKIVLSNKEVREEMKSLTALENEIKETKDKIKNLTWAWNGKRN